MNEEDEVVDFELLLGQERLGLEVTTDERESLQSSVYVVIGDQDIACSV